KKPKMAEIVLTFVVEEMLKKLASLALEGVDLAWGLKGKLQKLNETLTFIRAVLHDAVERQGREESVKIWLQKLRDVAYKAEDALDEFGYEVLRQKVEGGTPSRKVSNFFSASSNPIAFRLHMGKKIKKINEELAEIKSDVAGLELFKGNPTHTTFMRQLLELDFQLSALYEKLYSCNICFYSGTLSYIFNSFVGTRAFSDVVTEAKQAGFTEPDPRDDLSGTDVARKVIILARESGLKLELSDIPVQSLVPEPLRDSASADEFMKRLPQFDPEMAGKRKEAEDAGDVSLSWHLTSGFPFCFTGLYHFFNSDSHI
ncbi:hypothetical protein Tsubulata_018328, partial [Turnera subulata]